MERGTDLRIICNNAENDLQANVEDLCKIRRNTRDKRSTPWSEAWHLPAVAAGGVH
jgi:hypothetical protein